MEHQQRGAKRRLPSLVIRRTVKISGSSTSVTIEDPFWGALKEIAAARNVGVYEMISTIDRDRQHGNLSSTLRLFVLDYYRALAGAKRP
jgi:predicted DNA-binding ribbon-helix-helix protein